MALAFSEVPVAFARAFLTTSMANPPTHQHLIQDTQATIKTHDDDDAGDDDDVDDDDDDDDE